MRDIFKEEWGGPALSAAPGFGWVMAGFGTALTIGSLCLMIVG